LPAFSQIMRLDPRAFKGRDFTFVTHDERSYLVLHTERGVLNGRGAPAVKPWRRVEGVYEWKPRNNALKPVGLLSKELREAVRKAVAAKTPEKQGLVDLGNMTWPRVPTFSSKAQPKTRRRPP